MQHNWRRNLVLFLVDSCIPARQWTDICNTRCSILSRFSHFHVSHFQRPLSVQQASILFLAGSLLRERSAWWYSSLKSQLVKNRYKARYHSQAFNVYRLIFTALRYASSIHAMACALLQTFYDTWNITVVWFFSVSTPKMSPVYFWGMGLLDFGNFCKWLKGRSGLLEVIGNVIVR